jgi:hypothetical protein
MKRMAVLILTSVLFGCGGGSGSNSGVANSITGKVIDGYISGGTVFWDCDLNGKLDTGEVSTTSSAGGVYTISPSPQSGCRLTALIPASAIDEDTGKSVFTPYAMTALDSNSTIISPLTTLAVLHPTSSQSVAADEIKTKFNLTLALDTDYVAQTTSDSTNTRKFAKVTAQLLQANYSTTSGYSAATNTTIVNGIAAIQSTITSTSLSDIINRVISLPSDLWNKILYIFYADPSLKVKVSPYNNLSNSQSAYLNSLIVDSRITPYIGSGQVYWNRVDLSALKEINTKLLQNGFTSPDTSKLNSDHYLQSQIINAKFATLSANANTFITLDKDTMLALFDVADATVKGAYGTAKMASVVPNLSGVFAYVNMTPGVQGKMIKNIAKIKKYTDFIAATAKCGDGISDLDVFTQSSISPSDYAKGLGGVSKIVGCVGDMIDSKGVSYVAGLFQGGSDSFDDQFDGIMTLFDTLNIAIGLTPPTPYSNFVSGFIDLASAGVESYKAGQTIAKQAGAKTDIAQSDLDTLQKSQLAVLDKAYYTAVVRALTTNSIIREDWVFTPPTTPLTVLSAFQAGTYDYSTDMQCYYKNTLGSSVGTNEYAVSETKYCLNSAKNAWVQTTDDAGLLLLPNGSWVSGNSPNLVITGDNSFTSNFGGYAFQSGTLTQNTVGANYPSGSISGTVSVTDTRDRYMLWNITNNSYLYNNTTGLDSMISTWNSSFNGQATLSQTNKYGWSFVTPPVSDYTAGIYKLYDISQQPTCTTTGTGANLVTTCGRPVLAQGAWTKNILSDGSPAIELNAYSPYTDLLLFGNTGQRALYVKRASDSGVREGARKLAGGTRSFNTVNRTYMNADLAARGYPTTVN